MTLPVPLNRTELFLAKIAGEDVTPPEPQSRQEMFLAKLAGADIVLPEPLSLTEQWLALCAGMAGVTAPEIEGACLIGVQKVDVRFFAVASGLDGVTAPEPQNRTEEFWAKIAEEMSVKTITVKGTDLHLLKIVSGIDDLQYVYGDTSQQTYSGKNLFNINGTAKASTGNNAVSYNIVNDNIIITQTGDSGNGYIYLPIPNPNDLLGKTVTISAESAIPADGSTGSRIRIVTNSTATEITTQFKPSTTGGSKTFTFPDSFQSGDSGFRIYFYVNSSNVAGQAGANITYTKFQLELGSSATPYEPYVGGTASPNPDYPQDVKVVTGEQTVTISDGVNSHNFTMNLKTANLFDSATVVNGNLQANGTVNTSATGYSTTDFIEIDSSLPIIKTATGSPRVKLYDSSKNVISTAQYNDIPNFNTSGSHDITYKNAKYIRFSIYLADYPLDGVNIYQPIELAKIGTYQDYIYKSGGNWYVSRQIGKVTLDGTVTPDTVNTDMSNTTRVGWNSYATIFKAAHPDTDGIYSNYFLQSSNWNYDRVGISYANTNGGVWFRANKTTIGTTSGEVVTWLANHHVDLYFIKLSATQEQITDNTLISQLNTLDSAILPTPEAFVTVSGDLPAPIQFTYEGKE